MITKLIARILLGCVLAAALLGAPVQAAPSATFTVNSLTENEDILPGDGLCNSIGGWCTLRAAVMEANALPGADVINLMAGTYNMTMPLPVQDDVTINGVSYTYSILDGPGTAGVHAFELDLTYYPNVDFVLSAVTVRDFAGAISTLGNQLKPGTVLIKDSVLRDNIINDASYGGGAVMNNGLAASVVIRNTTLINNSAPYCGAITNQGSLTIEQNSIIRNNWAQASTGGAICNKGGSLAINDSSIFLNYATGDSGNFGGAIYQNAGTTTVNNSQVYDNSANAVGGAFYILAGDLQVTNSSISENTADTGGGFALYGSGQTVLTNVSILENIAGNGGGIASGTNLTISQSDIISNTAMLDGGGMYLSGLEAEVLNSTVSGSYAVQNGAGLYVNSSATLRLGNVTVMNNTADSDNNGNGFGGGIYSSDGNVLVRNSVIAKNKDLRATQYELWAPDCYGEVTSDGFNLFGMVNFLCDLSGDMNGVRMGEVSPGLDPMLLPLTQDVYDTYHHPPQMGPVVDTGNPMGCRDFDGNLLMFDQRGVVRVFGVGQSMYLPVCDLGAVESFYQTKTRYLPLISR